MLNPDQHINIAKSPVVAVIKNPVCQFGDKVMKQVSQCSLDKAVLLKQSRNWVWSHCPVNNPSTAKDFPD